MRKWGLHHDTEILDFPLRRGVPARRGLSGACLSVCPVSHPKYFDAFGMFFCRAFEQFKEAINDEDFEDLLKDAQADPKEHFG